MMFECAGKDKLFILIILHEMTEPYCINLRLFLECELMESAIYFGYARMLYRNIFKEILYGCNM